MVLAVFLISVALCICSMSKGLEEFHSPTLDIYGNQELRDSNCSVFKEEEVEERKKSGLRHGKNDVRYY